MNFRVGIVIAAVLLGLLAAPCALVADVHTFGAEFVTVQPSLAKIELARRLIAEESHANRRSSVGEHVGVDGIKHIRVDPPLPPLGHDDRSLLQKMGVKKEGDYEEYYDSKSDEVEQIWPGGYYYQYALTANVSIGTPPQSFHVLVDLRSSDFYVTRVGAQYDSGVWHDSSPRFVSLESDPNEYDPTASSTYQPTDNGCFQENYGSVRGETVSDVVTLDGTAISQRLLFGAAKQVGYQVEYYGVDGVLGIGMGRRDNNLSSVVKQLVPTMKEPVVSFYLHQERGDNAGKKAVAEITLGGHDPKRCHSDWYFPINGSDPAIDVNTVSFTNSSGTFTIASPRKFYILYIRIGFAPLYVDTPLFQLFTNATGAKKSDNKNSWGRDQYTVDCRLWSSGPDFNFTSYKGGSIILHSSNYIVKQDDGTCVLNVDDAYGPNNPCGDSENCHYYMFVPLGQDFLNDHCMAFDIANKRVGFTDAK